MDRVALKQYSGIEWYFLAFKQYAVFKGRSSRLAFWFFAAYHVIVWTLLGEVDHILHLIFNTNFSPFSHLYMLVSLIPCLALTSRRLHDANFSHWWLIGLVPKLINYVLLVIVFSTLTRTTPEMYIFYIIAVNNIISPIFMVILLIFTLLASQPGVNKYGPNPYGVNS